MTVMQFEIYKCNICGMIVQVLNNTDGELQACGHPMVKLQENTVDASKEKHVPIVEKVDGGIIVKVGSEPHPMEEKHYIMWIEVIAGNKSCMHYLKPGDAPEAFFPTNEENIIVREYCNQHGLWRN